MKQVIIFILLVLFSVCNQTTASAFDALDGVLPTPYLLRSRADDLNIDASTKARLERMYKAAEPKYHLLKEHLEACTRRARAEIVAEPFDTARIEQEIKNTIQAENDLTLYQAQVRIRLLSQVTAQQRQGARNYASERSEAARWRGDVLAGGELDAILPRPFWLRSRAEELGIDATTRQRLEQTYQSSEPRYHELKQLIEPLTKQLLEVLLAENLDEGPIVKRLTALLEVESKLKLHQVGTRSRLLSQLSGAQRWAARELAIKKPEADWRKVLSKKVSRVRELEKQLGTVGQSVANAQTQLVSIQELISEGRATEGGRRLDQLLREMESRLDSVEQARIQEEGADALPPPTFSNIAYGPHRRNVLDLWQAESDHATPLAVYFHGGGFRVFDKGKIKTKWPSTVKALLEAKISVAAVNYRLIDDAPLPAAFHDARRALQFLRLKSTDWNLDASRVAAWGGSAGAQIAMYLAFHDEMADRASDDPVEQQSTRLTCVATRDGQTSRDYQWWIDHIPGYQTPHIDFHAIFGVESRPEFLERMVDVSALSLITSDDPPIFMMYDMRPDDPIPEPTEDNPRAQISFQGHHVVFGIELKKKMDAFGIPTYLRYPGSDPKYRTVEAFFVAMLKPTQSSQGASE